MPYIKTIGKTPFYKFGIVRTIYDDHLAKFLDSVKVPNMREGMYMVYEDSFDAYVKKIRKLGPFERKLHSLFH
jgi:hypothetical protein